jgi:acyl-CoA synthetase (NDP forming)/GNAT superfamily N-acetyltransferase
MRTPANADRPTQRTPAGNATAFCPDGDHRDQSVDVALRDGSSVHVRPVRPSDRDAMHRFLSALSSDSLYMRCCGIPNIDRLADWSVDLDHYDRYVIVATIGPEDQILAHAAYIRLGSLSHRAEVAFEVADVRHGQGISTLLLAHLAGVAVSHDITEFVAEVMPSNHRMLAVLHSSGFPIRSESTDGLTDVVLDTSLTTETLERFEARERGAATAAMKAFLEPTSVAVIGASARRRTAGAVVLSHINEAGYPHALYPVNPRHRHVQSTPTHPSIADLAEAVDLAVVAVPAQEVVAVAQQCGAAGVRALLVISAGFAEAGLDGEARQADLRYRCREWGMRLIGPNSIGVLNTDLWVRLNASLIDRLPARGSVGLMSQSGSVGVAIVAATQQLGIGLSTFVAVGNKADISGNDLLAYWEQDAATKIILLYLESFGNPRRFARTARRVARHKPIIAVKSDGTPAGEGAIASAAGGMLTASDVRSDALLAQTGVIRVNSISEMLEVTTLLSATAAPAGKRVAVLANGAGTGHICADACRAAGLEVSEPSIRLARDLARVHKTLETPQNPINLTPAASASDFRCAVALTAASGEFDSVLAIVMPSLAAPGGAVAEAMDAAALHSGSMTVATVLMGRTMPSPRRTNQRGAARFAFPEAAARALSHAARWSLWRSRSANVVTHLTNTEPERARELLATALAAGAEELSDHEAGELLACYGLVLTPADDSPSGNETELTAGIVDDPSFGPLVVCGVSAEGSVGATAVGLTPLTDADAEAMVSSVGGFTEQRSAAGVRLGAVAALTDLILRLGAMAVAHPQIAALDLTPIWISPAGILIGGVRVLVRPAVPSAPVGAIR